MNENFLSFYVKIVSYIVLALILIMALAWGISALDKEYSIWAERKRGEAEYAHAEANRRIAILEAEAKMQSAKALSNAEVIRAEGVAKANKIIGDSLKENEGYLRYLYITHLSDAKDKTIIYIPTEGSLPILESQRLR
jgi:regulator of protease activity HflC (stomatin/prohibitin superfamily)